MAQSNQNSSTNLSDEDMTRQDQFRDDQVGSPTEGEKGGQALDEEEKSS